MKRTPWYPIFDSPVRDGLYEWRCQSIFAREGTTLRSWTHGGWDDLNPCPKCQWRGLAQPSERMEG